MPDTAPIYPEVEHRRHLSKKQKVEVILRQHGRCAGCGIKPKAWEFDHDKALWKGETDQANLDTWVAYGSRKDCDCHLRKTSAEAGERAKMKRVRSDTERHATRMKAKATLAREVFKRERRAESKIQSRGFQKPLLPTSDSRKPDGAASFAVSALSKHSRGYRKRSWPKRGFSKGSIQSKAGQS